MTANRNAALVGKDLKNSDCKMAKTFAQWNSFLQSGFGIIRNKSV